MNAPQVEKWVYRELEKHDNEHYGPLVEMLWDKFCHDCNVFCDSYFDYNFSFLERENSHISQRVYKEIPKEVIQYLASFAERIEGGDRVQEVSFITAFVNIAVVAIECYIYAKKQAK